jgi:hypothetical protein
MEEADWSIHYLVVDTKNWWPGKRVLVSPRSVTGIDWTDNLVNINVGRQRVKDSQHMTRIPRLIEPTSKNIMNTTVRFGQAISCKGRPFWILPLARMPRSQLGALDGSGSVSVFSPQLFPRTWIVCIWGTPYNRTKYIMKSGRS